MTEGQTKDEACRNVVTTLSALYELGVRCGLEHEELQELSDRVLADLSKKKPDLGSDRSLTVRARDFLSAMNTQWHEHESYADEQGYPQSLPSFGANPSLESLYQHTQALVGAPPMSCESAISLLIDHNAVVESNDGLWRPTNRAFSVNKRTTVGVNVQLSYLAEVSETIKFNANRPSGDGRFHTVASVSDFPVDELKGLQVICAESGMSFLTEADSFLLRAREDARGTSKKKTTAGVGVYLFVRG